MRKGRGKKRDVRGHGEELVERERKGEWRDEVLGFSLYHCLYCLGVPYLIPLSYGVLNIALSFRTFQD